MIGKRSSIRSAMNRRGISGKWKAMWHSSPSPKYAAASSGHWFASASSMRSSKRASTCARSSFRNSCVSGRFSQIVPSRSIQVRHRVEAQPVDAQLEPVVDGAQHLPPHLGVVEVEVGLVRVEAVPVVRPGDRVPRPVRRLEVLEDDARVAVAVRRVAPHVAVAVPAAGRRPARPLEPRVLIGGVVEHELGDDPQPALVRLVEEAPELPQGAVGRVDAAVVGDVVAVVAQRRRVERQQPDRGDAEVLEVVEPLREPDEVADAVAVAVGERAHVQLVDDGVLVPVGSASTGRARLSDGVAAGRTDANTCAGTRRGVELDEVARPVPRRSDCSVEQVVRRRYVRVRRRRRARARSSAVHPDCVCTGSRLTTNSTTSSCRRHGSRACSSRRCGRCRRRGSAACRRAAAPGARARIRVHPADQVAQAVGPVEVPVPHLVLLGVEVLLAARLARRCAPAARTPARRCRSSR